MHPGTSTTATTFNTKHIEFRNSPGCSLAVQPRHFSLFAYLCVSNYGKRKDTGKKTPKLLPSLGQYISLTETVAVFQEEEKSIKHQHQKPKDMEQYVLAAY